LKILLCYITVTGGAKTLEYAHRFACTYSQHPPGYPHDQVVVCNGGRPAPEMEFMYGILNNGARMLVRENDGGWDISAYIEVARDLGQDYDLMLCLGESIHFHRFGWLLRLVEAYRTHGPGMYGAFASNTVRAHINTTGFAISPRFLAEWPTPVTNRQERYDFEHGENSIWRRTQAEGFPTMLVTWDGFWHPQAWRVPANILWRGNQTNCLMYCSHTDNWFAADKERRARWLRMADAPFR